MRTSINNDIRNINIKLLPRTIGQLFEYMTGEDRTKLEVPKDTKWDIQKQSKYIESLMIGIPVTSLYIEESEDNSWISFDGVERLSAIYNFLSNAFTLLGLDIYTEKYEGVKYEDLPTEMKRKIKYSEISVLLIGKETPISIKNIIHANLHN